MSGLKTKFTIYKVLSWVVILSGVALFLFSPIYTLEWEKETLGITEEYYADISLADWVSGGRKQIHLKNAKDYENALGITAETVDRLLGNIDIDKDVKGEHISTTTNSLFSMIFLLVIMSVMLVFIIIMKKQQQKLIEKVPKWIQLAANNELDKKTEKKFYRVVFGIDHSTWTGVFGFPILLLIFGAFLNIENENAMYDIGLSINCVYFILAFAIITAFLQVFTILIIKEIKANNIIRYDQIFPGKGAIVTAPKVDVPTILTTETPAESASTETSSAEISTVEAKNANALLEYKKLLDAGVITQEEFDRKKKQLLGL